MILSYFCSFKYIYVSVYLYIFLLLSIIFVHSNIYMYFVTFPAFHKLPSNHHIISFKTYLKNKYNLIFQIEINFWLSLVYIVNIHCKNLILIFCVSFPFFLYGSSMPFYPVNRFLDIKPFKDLCMLWKYRLGIFSTDFHYIVKSSCPTVDLLTVLPDCIAKVFNMSSATPDSRLIKIRWHPWLIADM